MDGFKIKIFTANGVERMTVSKSHFVVGTAAHCEIRLAQDGIAPEHLRVWSEGGKLWAQDLGSDSSSLNGSPLQTMRPILFRETDIFKLGTLGITLAVQLLGATRAPNLVMPQEDDSREDDADHLRLLEQDNQLLRRELDKWRKKASEIPASEEEITEISHVKTSALQEINSMKEAEARRFEVWKRESVQDVHATVVGLMQNQARKKGRSELSLREFDSSLELALRSVLLGDEQAGREVRRVTESPDTNMRLVYSVIIAALLCCGVVGYSLLKRSRQPASLVVVAPSTPRPTLTPPQSGLARTAGKKLTR